MGWALTLYTVPLAVAGVVGLAVSALVWQHRPRAGAGMLGLNLFGNVLWAFGQAGAVSVTTAPALRTWTTVSLLGLALLTPAWLLFALRYTGFGERVGRPVEATIALPAVVFAALAVVNPGTVIEAAAVTGDGSLQWGPAKWAFLAYAYPVGVAGGGLLLWKVAHSRNVYRARTFVILAGGSAVIGGHVISVAGASPTPLLTLSPLLFLAFAVLTLAILASDRVLQLLPIDRLVELLGGRFRSIAPIARDLVIEKMGSGVLVLDDDNRIVDLNPRARQFLGTGDRRVVGRRIEAIVEPDVFDDDPEFFDTTVRTGTFDGVWVTTPDGQRRCYDIVVTDLAERRDDVAGRVAIVHDVTEQQRRKRQLTRRTAQLERQNERLEEFASVASHDLRNPLNVAQGRLELAEEKESLAELDGVRDAHERMTAIIDELLALAREGQTVRETTAIDVGELAREAWETVDTGEASLVVGTDGLTVEADEARLRRALENLYRNALEHGPDASDALAVRVGRLDGDRGFFVSDDGPGITAEDREAVFEHGFSTADDGTGFGLAIVESIVEAHGGSITVTESDEGGARFEIQLHPLSDEVDRPTADA